MNFGMTIPLRRGHRRSPEPRWAPVTGRPLPGCPSSGHHARGKMTGSPSTTRAGACGMAYCTMLAKVHQGELPAEKPGGAWRLKGADVEAFIEGSRVGPGEPKAAPVPH